MPAAWQKWMPLHIDKFWGSPSVQRMSNSAFKGYMSLITAQWQSEDCSLPSNMAELAELSRLSDEDWGESSSSVLRKFPSMGTDRLRNNACYEMWAEAKARYEEGQLQYEFLREKRRDAGKFGAEKKWGERPSGSKVRSERLSAARERGRHTTEQWALLLAFCGTACLRCGARAKLNKDHIKPIYQGGSDSIENIQPLCAPCNSSKGPEVKDYRPDGWQNACQTPAECVAIGGLTHTETHTETVKQKPSGKPGAEARHQAFHEQIDRYWKHKTGEEKAPWDGSEGKALSALLAAKPDLTLEQFRICLKHRGDTPSEVQTERPRQWLPNILRFAGGPLDRYGKPLQAPILPPKIHTMTREEAMAR